MTCVQHVRVYPYITCTTMYVYMVRVAECVFPLQFMSCLVYVLKYNLSLRAHTNVDA